MLLHAANHHPCASCVLPARSVRIASLVNRAAGQRTQLVAYRSVQQSINQSQQSRRRIIPTQSSMANAPSQRAKVLFVCLGNICRSPTAEAVFSSVAERRGVASSMTIDSCGTGGGNPDWYREGGWSYHEGDASDARMRDHASRRGITLTSRSRPLTPQDLTTFDYIVAMDDANVQAIVTAAEYWKSKHDVPPRYRDKVVKMTQYLKDTGRFSNKYDSVPDPYYGGAAGFELVLDLLEDACEGLLDRIQSSR